MEAGRQPLKQLKSSSGALMSLLRLFRVALIVATGFVIGLSFGVAEQSQQAKQWLEERTG